MNRPICFVVFVGVVWSSCKTPAPKPAAPLNFVMDSSQSTKDSHHSRNSLDWAGTYRGVVPCADCPGIATTLTLNPDNTYVLQIRHLGKDDSGNRYNGNFQWRTDGGTIALAGLPDASAPGLYQVGENRLIQLDRDGNAITTSLAPRYVLSRITETIAEKYWKLIEVMGTPVSAGNTQKEPHIILHSSDKSVTGNGGCNSFRGGYELMDRNRIRFSQLAATQMACPGMATEGMFFKALNTADSYTIDASGDTLQLNRARMAPLARFVAIALK